MFGMSKSGAPKKAAPKKVARKPALVSVTVKLDAKRRDKLKTLGGDAWLREQIDAASVPKSTASPFTVADDEA
ncbi:MAG: hypothetical protein ABIT82_04325 [Ramlibacter sp.]